MEVLGGGRELEAAGVDVGFDGAQPGFDGGELVGIVTLQDLMRFRSQKSMLLVGSIKEAEKIDDLVKAAADLQDDPPLKSATRAGFSH